jgi:hypothetical protein
MKQLLSPPRALLDLPHHHLQFDVRLKKTAVNNKHLYYLLIASDTDTDHDVDCIRHYNPESQRKIKLSTATGNFFLLLTRLNVAMG